MYNFVAQFILLYRVDNLVYPHMSEGKGCVRRKIVSKDEIVLRKSEGQG